MRFPSGAFTVHVLILIPSVGCSPAVPLDLCLPLINALNKLQAHISSYDFSKKQYAVLLLRFKSAGQNDLNIQFVPVIL